MERVKLSDRPLASSPLAGPRTETIQLVPVEPAHGLLDMPFVPQEAPVAQRYSVRARLFAGLVVARSRSRNWAACPQRTATEGSLMR